MKTAIFAVICVALSIALKAQCNKNIKWTSSKSEFIDTAGNVQQSRDETVELTTGSKKISIVLTGEHADSMTGDVSDYTCNWKDSQNGKAVIKSTLVDAEGKTRHATITIEEVSGKTNILLVAEEEPTKIRLSVASFEEVQ
jgi:hypothetical protein